MILISQENLNIRNNQANGCWFCLVGQIAKLVKEDVLVQIFLNFKILFSTVTLFISRKPE